MWGRVRRKRSDGGVFEDAAKGQAEHSISGMAVSLVAHERMYEADNRKSRPGSIANWGPTTIGVPAEDLAGETQASHRVRASGKLHATRWHLENVRSACCVEHVRPLQEARERLAILAIANEAEASGRRNPARDAVHVAAPAPKREVEGHTCLVIACEHLSAPHELFVYAPNLVHPLNRFKILADHDPGWTFQWHR
jgi:hypothetical protein